MHEGMALIGQDPFSFFLFQNNNKVIAIFEEKRGEYMVAIDTFGFDANLIAYFLPEILGDGFDRH